MAKTHKQPKEAAIRSKAPHAQNSRPTTPTMVSSGSIGAKELPSMGRDIKRCPSCGNTEIIFDNERGEYICNNCGLVIEENVTDEGPEWRAFDSDQRNARARTGAPIKYMKPNKGLVTEIDMYNKDIKGTKLSSKARRSCTGCASGTRGQASQAQASAIILSLCRS